MFQADQVEKGETETEGKDGQDKSKEEQDVLYVQDVGFNVKIQVPGIDSFSLQVPIKFEFAS